MTDFFSHPDDFGEIQQSELHASLGESLGAQAKDSLDPKNSLSGMYILRRMREENAGGGNIGVPGAGGELDVFSGQPIEQRQAASDAFRAAVPETSIADAKSRVKQEGLEQHLKLPEQPSIKSPVLDLMISEAHERRDREIAIARGPQGFVPGALGVVTSIGAGMIDPVNAAAFSVPVLGEARMGKLLASAGDSIINRAGIRAIEGGVQGAAGTALLQPADWWLHSQDGQDYTFADALKSIALGAGMGAGFHTGIGAFGDIRARRRGDVLPGSPADLLQQGLMAGTHVTGEALASDGMTAEVAANIEQLLGGGRRQAPTHPAEILEDLPPAAREDAVRSAVADVIADRPVRAGEMLDIAADHDPRIAESFEAWHGSPHDFDRFDLSKVGTGEGAQAYGHGLYFAEKEKVAADYKTALAGTLVNGREYDGNNPIHAAAMLVHDMGGSKEAALEAVTHWPADTDGFKQNVEAAIKAKSLPSVEISGHLYKVRITAHPDHFLDWDKPLGEHPEPVRSKLRAAGFDDSQTGKDIYHSLVKYRPDQGGATSSAGMRLSDLDATPAAASGRLRATGIHGIKYLDQGSRGGRDATFTVKAKDGSIVEQGIHDENYAASRAKDVGGSYDIQHHETRNFVVFDDKHIEITHKNGEAVTLPGKPVDPVDAVNSSNAAARAADPAFYAGREKTAGVSHGERAAAAAQDPRWKQLGDVKPAYDDPQTVAESQAADAVTEPASVTPKAITAIERAATEAEEAWRQVEDSYTDKEKALVNDALATIDAERKETEDLIKEGAACLAAAEAV